MYPEAFHDLPIDSCLLMFDLGLHLQARTALAYEGVVDGARHEVAARADAAVKAEKAAAERMQGIIHERDELRSEADRAEATLKSLSHVQPLMSLTTCTEFAFLQSVHTTMNCRC
jgi:hypothetical protein